MLAWMNEQMKQLIKTKTFNNKNSNHLNQQLLTTGWIVKYLRGLNLQQS